MKQGPSFVSFCSCRGLRHHPKHAIRRRCCTINCIDLANVSCVVNKFTQRKKQLFLSLRFLMNLKKRTPSLTTSNEKSLMESCPCRICQRRSFEPLHQCAALTTPKRWVAILEQAGAIVLFALPAFAVGLIKWQRSRRKKSRFFFSKLYCGQNSTSKVHVTSRQPERF